MIAADLAVQRPSHARLLAVDASGAIADVPRARFVDLLHPGDLVVANDAATFPASLHGMQERTGASVEVRLAGRASLDANDIRDFTAVVFGAGDFHVRTEDRPLPPPLVPGDRLALGPLTAHVTGWLDHPRLVALRFDGTPAAIWEGLARHGRPIQYAHVPAPLELWDMWTPIAGPPAAFEPPSAGFVLDWRSIQAMHRRQVRLVTITHAAGISSTGDDDLDRRLPLDEPYRISEGSAAAIQQTRERGGRVVAIGTTVVRALEHAAACDGIVHAGDGVATGRIGPSTRLRIIDAILSGTHEAGSSHYDLLRAFMDDETLKRADAALEARGYRTHEFGDSVLIERRRKCARLRLPVQRAGREFRCTPGSSLLRPAS